MGNRRIRRFKPEPDERAVDVVPDANITEEEAETAAQRFIRKYDNQFPRLAAALGAEVEEIEE